jgi:hypothetical protein
MNRTLTPTLSPWEREKTQIHRGTGDFPLSRGRDRAGVRLRLLPKRTKAGAVK